MGNQFGHLQTFCQKANPAGQSVEQVLGEMKRAAEYSTHVENPQPPTEIFGSIDALESKLTSIIETKVSVNVKGKMLERKLRADRHILLAGVLSYPDDFETYDPERYEFWKARCVEFLKSEHGENLECVIEHSDETYPHLHFYVLPDPPDFNAKMHHIGHSAKIKKEAEEKAKGTENREAVKLGNIEYKSAMRDWQDRFFEAVSAPTGIARTGPKRKRLSRDEWKRQKEGAEALSVFNAEKEAEKVAKAAQEARERLLSETTAEVQEMRENALRSVKIEAMEQIQAERLALRKIATAIRQTDWRKLALSVGAEVRDFYYTKRLDAPYGLNHEMQARRNSLMAEFDFKPLKSSFVARFEHLKSEFARWWKFIDRVSDKLDKEFETVEDHRLAQLIATPDALKSELQALATETSYFLEPSVDEKIDQAIYENLSSPSR